LSKGATKFLTERGGLTEAELEEWWQNERKKIKPLDASYFAFTFNPDNSNNNRRRTRAGGYIINHE
jgi:ABC-type thiamine transport system substrate-binding protein